MDIFKRVSKILIENKLSCFDITLKVNGISITYDSKKLIIEYLPWEYHELGLRREDILNTTEEIANTLKKYEPPKSIELINVKEEHFEKLISNIDIEKCEKIVLNGAQYKFFVRPEHINHLLIHSSELKEINVVCHTNKDLDHYAPSTDLDFKSYFMSLDDVEIKKMDVFSLTFNSTSMKNTSFEVFMDLFKKKFHPRTWVKIQFKCNSSLKFEKPPFKEPYINFKWIDYDF